jgi:hypothetical protein
MKVRKAFSKFLKSSLENKLQLTEIQIRLLEELTREEIAERIQEADWFILEEEVQNDVSIYTLIDRVFICVCGKEPDHWHNGKIACCGDSDCCPDAIWDEPPDIEVEIAWNVGQIRQMFIR